MSASPRLLRVARNAARILVLTRLIVLTSGRLVRALATAGALTWFSAGAAAADPGPTLPTARQVDDARRSMPTPAAIDNAQAGVHVPRISVPSNGRGVAPQALELGDLMRQFRDKSAPVAPAEDANRREVSGVILFVTFGMPRPSLDRMIDDAARLQAPLILRGLVDGSMRATRQRIAELMGTRRVAWQIDPTLFARFDVTVAPTLVIVDPAKPVTVQCTTSQCTPPAFAKVAGDVTAAYALRHIAERDAAHADAARNALATLSAPRKDPR